MESTVVSWEVFLWAVGFAVAGWLLSSYLWVVHGGRLAEEVKRLNAFIDYFVDQGLINEVLVRSAYVLSAVCQAEIRIRQGEDGMGSNDAKTVEEALEFAKERIQQAKPKFFRPLDSVRGWFWSAGQSHKSYLVPSGPECLKAIDDARRKIAEELAERSPVSASSPQSGDAQATPNSAGRWI